MKEKVIVTIFILCLPVICYSGDIIVGKHLPSHSSWAGSGPVEVEQSCGKYIGKIRLAEGKTLVHSLLKEKLTPLEFDQIKISFQVRGKIRPASIQISCRIVKMDGSIQEWPMAKDWDVRLNTWQEFETPVNGPDVKYFRNVLCTKARKKGMAFMSPAPIKKISLVARVKSAPEDGLWLLWKPVCFSKRTHKVQTGDSFCPDSKKHRVLLLRKAADGFTHFAETIKNLGDKYQLSEAKVVSQQFGIPVLDDAAILAKQRLVVIKNMDSALFTPDQVQVIKNYVEAGGSLLVMAGPANMEKSLFPVRFEGYPAWQLVKPANNVPDTTGKSKIKSADIGFLRNISWDALAESAHISKLQTQKTAEPLLSIGESPVLVKKACGKGMVLLFTAYPNWKISDNFFLGNEYKKFLTGMIAHLCDEMWTVPANSPPKKTNSDDAPCKLHLPFGVDYACPTHPFRFQAKVHSSVKDCKLHCKVTDAKGAVIHRFPAIQIGDGEIIKFKWDVPMLTSGKYRLSVVLCDEKGRGLYSEDKNLHIGPWIDNTSRFNIIGYMEVCSKGLLLDPTEIDIQLDDLQAHGFNTVSVPLANRFSRKEGSIVSRMQNYVIRGAVMRGMGIVNDLNTDFLPFLGNPAAIPKEERISPLSHGYQSALAKKLEDALAYQSHIPCLIDVSYWDEAAMNLGFLCRSQFCADEFHEQMGYPLPSNIIDVKKYRVKREIHNFFSDLYAKEHAAVTHLAYAKVPGLKMRHIYCSRGAGNGAFTRRAEDPIKWTESGDIISYDSYAYFYPASYKPRYRFAALHWLSAFFRNLALTRGKILENYVELDDRNHKYVVSPKEASSENAYLALAQGANRINTFIHRYGLNNMSRRERWDHLGCTLDTIKKLGPLWKNYNQQSGQVAVLFGFHQWLADSYYRPMYAYETILQEFGRVDIIQERLLATKGLDKRTVIFLLGIEYLSDDACEKLMAFLRKGGLIIYDTLPSKNENGLTSAATGKLCKALQIPNSCEKVSLTSDLSMSLKKGVARLSRQLESYCEQLVETEQWNALDKLGANLLGYIERIGVCPIIRKDDPQIEVGLRDCSGNILAVAVNHNPEAKEVVLNILDGGSTQRIIDIRNGKTLNFQRSGARIRVPLQLNKREGCALSLLPELANKLSFQDTDRIISPGKELKLQIKLSTEEDKQIGYSTVIHLILTNLADESIMLYDEYKLVRNGQFVFSLKLPFNLPLGKYKLKAIMPIEGLNNSTVFSTGLVIQQKSKELGNL